MKKFLSAVVAFAIIATCSCFVSAAQPVIEGTNNVAVAVSDVAVTDPSAKVYVPVNISFADSFAGITGATVKFTFDTEKLSFDKNSSTIDFAVAGDTAMISKNASDVITVQFISSDLETARKDGDVLATLAFDVIDGAYGEAEIAITSAKLAKADGTPAANNTANGTVTIPKINNVEVAVSDVAVTDASAKVYVPVNISFADSFAGITGATVKFTFDTEKLSFDKNSSTIDFAVTGDTAMISKNASDVITVQFISSDLETARKDGDVLATLAFDVVEGAYGEAEIAITSAKLAKADGTPATNGTTNGTVTIPKPKYTVNFADEKNVVSTPSVTEEIGTAIDLETLTGVDGFRFLGWSDGENTYTDTYTVTKNIILTALWKTVYTPEIAEGTALTPEQQAVFVKYIEGEKVTAPTLSDTESHTFTGWKASYTEDGTPVDVPFTGEFTYPDAQVTFSAVFTEKPKYTVTYNMNGHGSAIEAVTDYVGKEITLPNPSKDGHFSFGGWENGNDTLQGGSQFVISETITLKAIWIEDEKFDVTFTSQYGTAPETIVGKYEGDEITLVQLTDPNGAYKHTGWTDGTNNYDTTGTYTVVDGENALTATWVEYGAALATFTTAKGTKPEDIKKYNNDPEGTDDTTITLPDITDTIAHWTFDGWQKNGEGEVLAAESSVVLEEGTTSFVAKWTEDPKATVTYVDDVATAPAADTDYVGETITVAAPGTAPAGYEFLGWTDGETTYQQGDTFVLGADGIILTAKWGVKVTLNLGGAKGEAPVIGDEIGETVILSEFGTGTLSKANHTFLGWSLTEGGEIVTEYTIAAENNVLYAVWEEIVADAAIIETKVTYYTGTGSYLVDLYFYGADANAVAFGYKYGENLTLLGFAPAGELQIPHDSLVVDGNGYYVSTVSATMSNNGYIAGGNATSGNGVHLGTLSFSFNGTKEDYAEDDENDNIIITAPLEEIDAVCSEDYFLFVPHGIGLELERRPVVFDEVVEVEYIDIVYPVNGSVKLIREDGKAPRSFATIKAVNSAGATVKTFTIENEETTTTNGVFTYSIELPEGEYTLEISKAGYLTATVEDVVVEAQEGAEEEGFEAVPVEVEFATLTPGDVVGEFGTIDLLDFVGITSAFDRDDLTEEQEIALDINEDGTITISDLNYVRNYLIAE